MQKIKGVQFVIDSSGHKTAVLLDLREWGELWEDVYDVIIAKARADEPSIKLEDFEEELASDERN